jgi:hypothetical protein
MSASLQPRPGGKNNKGNINTWDQALLMGDNRKKNNTNYDKAYPELKLI